ncbi:Clp protease (plasmid) [Yersinia hibernica]|uniref:Clp protease n=2 Tax=Yersinia TaxID=629 RepID=A0A7U5PH25_YEREN|nr:Clp protease [Yersinia hibernica]
MTVTNRTLFIARSDVSQLKNIYADEDKEKLAENIRKNCTIWLSLKPRDQREQ